MLTEAQRQRIAQYQAQRERYLRARSQVHSREAVIEHSAILARHPRYPLLISIPPAILAATMIFDLLYLVTNDSFWTTAAFWLIPFAIIGAVAAAVTGAIDWWETVPTSRSKMIGTWYLVGNVAIVVLFVQGWFLRLGSAGTPSTTALVLSSMGAGVALLTGWLGGEFIDRLKTDSIDERSDYTPRSRRLFQFDDAMSDSEGEAQQRAHA